MALKRVSASSLPGFPQRQPEVGHLIRSLRQLMGQTQEQVAGVLGVSFSTLNRWENGHMQPSPLALKQVNSVLVELAQVSDLRLQADRQALLAKYMTVDELDDSDFEGRHCGEQAWHNHNRPLNHYSLEMGNWRSWCAHTTGLKRHWVRSKLGQTA